MSFKSVFTGEQYESYEERNRVDALARIEVERRLGRKLSYEEAFDGRIKQREDRSYLEAAMDSMWKPKLKNEKSNLEKLRDEIYSANDAKLEAFYKEKDTKKALALMCDIELDKEHQQAALDAERLNYKEPKQLAELKTWLSEYRLTEVGLGEVTAVEHAIEQFSTENHCPDEAMRLYQRAVDKRTARMEAHNAARQAKIDELKQQLIEVRSEEAAVTLEGAE